MRWMTFLLALALAFPAYAERTVQEASGERAQILNAQRDSTVIAFGLVFYADTVDSVWVQIDYPLSTATGETIAIIESEMMENTATLNARNTAIIGRQRIRWDHGKRAMDRLREQLE